MSDISLLPEDMRGKERTEEEKSRPAPSAEAGLAMHVPSVEADEDIEIIEVDEGDLAAVLSEEPFMTRLTYRMSLLVDQLRGRFTKGQEAAAPAKVPPQFFKPPRPGLVTTPGASPSTPSAGIAPTGGLSGKPMPGASLASGKPVVPGGGAKARIMPQTNVPRRVRVIRRIRKPVRVSLIPPEDLVVFSVDVGKRKWTLGLFVLFFTILITGGYFLISRQTALASSRLMEAREQNAQIQAQITEQLTKWGTYEDLEARLQILDTQLNKHIVVTRLFEFLEGATLPNVTYQNAVWSASDNKLALDVTASSYDATAQQVMVFEKQPLVVSVDASGFTAEKDVETRELKSVKFSLMVELKPNAFVGPAVIQTASDTATSSTNMLTP
ncbi:MAG: hypothetical protein KIH65_005100 [Candidatus Uhrbacteria bacterium]|nr:hypothetical protein [Candidatus Uhrbacteria bacterium]